MYNIVIERKAGKALKELPEQIIKKIVSVIERLKDEPVPQGSLKLKGKFKNGYRLRIGDYRVLYTVDEERKEVSIFQVGHRREIYR
ncbi:MAG: type II toxin-antitoxin system RelE/ParE family toxin [Candidatus Brocadiaceae bacterium]|nr:type II toxin-antitoxin system RelE/ParE family toxin [Candidatus Brocadiaceae bacterium]